ncbi:MAG: exo-alpha-sialidase, partial [Candidatus Eremiobacteraeota bacterium]|nr:exo-alpha-sialidase [Candidatus Eremiobacteraeota bacterium]
FGLFPGPNVQVTSHTWNPGERNARSECDLVTNPVDSSNLIAVSKRFYDFENYRFTVAAAFTTDGGDTWKKSSDLHLFCGSESACGYTDPALAMDNAGTAHLIIEPDTWTGQPFPNDINSEGMTEVTSTDLGASWSPLHWIFQNLNAGADKQWATADNTSSAFAGNVYVVWGAAAPLFFSKKLPGQKNWVGAGTDKWPTALTEDNVFAPAVCVSGDGTIHIAWHMPGTGAVSYMSSSDGGNTFSAPETCVSSIGDITNKFPAPLHFDPNNGKEIAGFSTFPGGTFRVMTLVSIAPVGQSGCIIAWADARADFTRIYYRIRADDGTWLGDDSGEPLLDSSVLSDSAAVQCFHPQLAVTPSGIIGCAFYEFAKRKDGIFRIDVKLASTSFFSQKFFFVASVTEKPWDPLVDAPFSHSIPEQPNLTFIGEYFGLDTADEDFCVLWTDTRTGHQELWFSRVATSRPFVGRPNFEPGLLGQLVGGVAVDGGGWVIVGGYPHPIPPSGPATEILQLLAANALVANVSTTETRQMQQMLFRAISRIASRASKGEELS